VTSRDPVLLCVLAVGVTAFGFLRYRGRGEAPA
jgi:hypothetical protein